MADRSQAPRNVEAPEAGYFSMRFVKGGPLVAARICCDVNGWWAELRGMACGEPQSDPMQADMVFDIWLGATGRITEAEYERLLDTHIEPGHPSRRPKQPIKLSKMKSLF